GMRVVDPKGLARIPLTVALASVAAACSASSKSGTGSDPGSSSPSLSQGAPVATPASPTSTATPATALATWPNKKMNGKIAFGRWLDSTQTTRAIFVINPDGTGEQQLTHPPDGVVDNHPDWSPDGSRIAFEQCSTRCETWVMKA